MFSKSRVLKSQNLKFLISTFSSVLLIYGYLAIFTTPRRCLLRGEPESQLYKSFTLSRTNEYKIITAVASTMEIFNKNNYSLIVEEFLEKNKLS
jgi:hypothetical protein